MEPAYPEMNPKANLKWPWAANLWIGIDIPSIDRADGSSYPALDGFLSVCSVAGTNLMDDISITIQIHCEFHFLDWILRNWSLQMLVHGTTAVGLYMYYTLEWDNSETNFPSNLNDDEKSLWKLHLI